MTRKHKDIVKYADYMYFPTMKPLFCAMITGTYHTEAGFSVLSGFDAIRISGIKSAGRTEKLVQSLISKSCS